LFSDFRDFGEERISSKSVLSYLQIFDLNRISLFDFPKENHNGDDNLNVGATLELVVPYL